MSEQGSKPEMEVEGEHQVVVNPVITYTRDPERHARLIALFNRIEARLAAEKAESTPEDSP